MNQNKQLNLEVLLMQPKEIPKELLASLSTFFKSRMGIRKAYFAVAQFSDSLDSMDYLIAIDAETDLADEIRKIKKYLDKINLDTGGKKLAIVDVNHNIYGGYFCRTSPFYKK